MPKKAVKQSTKRGQTLKNEVQEPNVTVYTDLPPDVHGQLRCYLVLRIDRFVWTGPRLQNGLNIVTKWWGEMSQGTVFRCNRLPGIAKYAIKCGPKQFTSYLNDMEFLTLDFVDAKSYRIQGVAKIDVRKLSKNNLILTDATINVPLSNQVMGKVNVSLNIVQAPKSLADQPTLDKNQPLKVSSAIKHPRTSSAKTSPIKFPDDKENIAFPSKNNRRNNVTDIINQVLAKSRNLKDELVKAQMQDLHDSDNIKQEIEANIDLISPECIQEVERQQMSEVINGSQADNTMDLFFGRDHINSMLKKHDLDVSFSSDSSSSSFHDESLIEHLFYRRGEDHDRTAVSSDSEIDESELRMNKHEPITRVKFTDPSFNKEESFVKDNLPLSLNKITGLGRVNKCKLFLNDLQFDAAAESGTYFVEYNIPIAEDEEKKTLTSRKVVDRSVNFEHINVFPVMFDEVLINQWQVRTAGFKVFYKERIEDTPVLVADASLRLKNVFLAENFDLNFALQMRSVQNDDYVGLLNGSLKLNSGDVSEIFLPKSNTAQKVKAVSLNMLISVVCGKAIQTKNKELVNSYVVARMIDSVERLSTDVVWDSHHPIYNSRHIVPFTYTSTFIDRLKDNFIILEVWNKSGTDDDLIGLCKLPTNQFSLSLSGENLQTFVEENVPIVAVDGYMPIIDILSNQRCGILQCILAVGSQSQLTNLLSQKNLPPVIVAKTPAEKPEATEHIPEITSKIRHMFNVTVNSVQDMDMFEGSSWGATDCFISFTLPVSSGAAPPELKTNSTTLSSAAPHMKFNHRTASSLVLSDAVSVQQYLSSTLEDNSVMFELWRRFYYPNVRDQVCARGQLTLQQLSHLISLNPGTEQCFKVPLSSAQLADDDGSGYVVGTLSVSVEYTQDTVTETQHATNFVQFCVGVHRACGLQYAAQRALKAGAPLEHAATVGVDSYVAIELSFAGIDRESSVRARSFTPNYGAHFSMTLPTVMSSTHSGPPTLAENISKGSVLVSLFHKVDGSSGKSSDILLCKAIVSLESLLQKQSGLRGWVSLQEPTRAKEHVASIELEIGFGEMTEREQVIQDACGRGWLPPPLPSISSPYLSLNVGVDRIWISDTILLRYRGAQDVVIEDRQCYLRIKFYNSEAVCSDLVNFSEVALDNKSYSDMDFTATFNFTVSTNLIWCLREEPLEIQVWLVPRGGKDDTIGDTILGCGYISLSELLAANHTPATSAQAVPLVKATSSNLGGAGVHVTTTLTKLEELPVEEPPQLLNPVLSLLSERELTVNEAQEKEEEIEGFKFRVTISQCTDLPTDQYNSNSLCIYCSVLCNSHTLLTTPYREFTSSVFFNCTEDIKVPYSVFTGSDKTVKCVVSAHDLNSQTDLCVVGTATVDLVPLLIGFPAVEGWYLVEDVYSKDTFGTIKVSFTPLELVSKEIVRSKIEELEQSLVSEQDVPTNFLKKVVAKRTDYLLPVNEKVTQPPTDLPKIENVFKSLADIDELIRSIGAGKVIPGSTKNNNEKGTHNLDIADESEQLKTSSESKLSSQSSSSSSTTTSSPSSSSSSSSSSKSQEKGLICASQAKSEDIESLVEESSEPKPDCEFSVLEEETVLPQSDTLNTPEDNEDSPDILLDTFDITVDTDCLSDTVVSDITQLLQDVQKQAENIENMLVSDEAPGSDRLLDNLKEETACSGEDKTTDLLMDDTADIVPEIEKFEHEGNLSENQEITRSAESDNLNDDSIRIVPDTVEVDPETVEAVQEAAHVAVATEKSGKEDTDVAPQTEVVQTDIISNRATIPEEQNVPFRSNSQPYLKIESQFKRPAVPDFFMAAKELSTTISELKRQRQPSKSNESAESEARSSTPVMCRRTPLTRLMGHGPNDDQRARIARIFRQ